MSNTNTGWPEFPTKGEERAFPSSFKSLSGQEQRHVFGMTLRDYFAAKAMEALMTHAHVLDWAEEGIADAAYRQADAMLAAREAA